MFLYEAIRVFSKENNFRCFLRPKGALQSSPHIFKFNMLDEISFSFTRLSKFQKKEKKLRPERIHFIVKREFKDCNKYLLDLQKPILNSRSFLFLYVIILHKSLNPCRGLTSGAFPSNSYSLVYEVIHVFSKENDFQMFFIRSDSCIFRGK